MSKKIDFTQMTQRLCQISGLEMGKYDDSFLRKLIENRLCETGCASPEDYGGYLERNPAEVALILNSLHIHFSEFFRDPLMCALLERVIIPELIEKKKADRQKEIRIWSAGCAGGQEPYSIAILLEEAISSTDLKLSYRIFATDLDETVLAQARLGRYSADALKNVSLKRAQTWFTRQGEEYLVLPTLQKHIDFSILDLTETDGNCPPASIFGEFDLVFCCNLLIYYQPQYRKLILNKFSNCITRGGFLVTGESERIIALDQHYIEVYPQAAIFRLHHRKEKKP